MLKIRNQELLACELQRVHWENSAGIAGRAPQPYNKVKFNSFLESQFDGILSKTTDEIADDKTRKPLNL